MKNNKWKGRWWLWIPIGILGLVIYSCLQGEWDPDANTTNEVVWNKNKELTVYEAERWYNANNLPVATVRSLGSETEVLTKPKWRNAKESRRKHFEVVETPLLVKGRAVFMDAETKGHFDPKKEAKKIRNVARMVIIKNLKTGEVSNFIMIFVGTYDYLMNTKTLWKNSYLHREPDYEGDVYFYKPGYGFVNGWRYKAGKIVATISPSTEADFRIQTRGGHEECYGDVTYEYYTECESGGYWDDEFGGWGGVSVCTTYESPIYTLICQWVEDGPDPVGPEEGGGGGYVPPTIPPTDPPTDPPTPCDKVSALSKDAAFNSRLNTIYNQTYPYAVGNTEHGFIQTSQGETISPAISEAGRVKYSSEQLAGKEFLEWYHSHPYGGPITSLADLKALATQYQQGHITSGEFTYGIVSEFGYLSIMISSARDFEAFAASIRSGELDSDFNIKVDNGMTVGTAEGSIQKLAVFLRDQKAGLSLLFCPMQNGIPSNWAPTELDSNANLINTDCN